MTRSVPRLREARAGVTPGGDRNGQRNAEIQVGSLATSRARSASWSHTDFRRSISMTTDLPSTRLRTPAVAAGLALAATATTLIGTTVDTAYAAAAHNEQVVLVNGTNAQADAKSMINGTAQVSSADGRYVVFSTAAALVAQDTN